MPIKLEIQAVVQHKYYTTTSSSSLAQPTIELRQLVNLIHLIYFLSPSRYSLFLIAAQPVEGEDYSTELE